MDRDEGLEPVSGDLPLASEEDILNEAREVISLGSSLSLTVGCAESCTGGLVSGALTAIAGSSAVVRGGVVSYAIPVKHEVLGVSREVLDTPGLGAVSCECAQQMAFGARRVLKSDVAVSITGIAGPGGAEPGKPVGTVWFGLDWGGGAHQQVMLFSGDRDAVRRKAVLCALRLLHEGLVRAGAPAQP